jgi:hypothetical protein
MDEFALVLTLVGLLLFLLLFVLLFVILHRPKKVVIDVIAPPTFEQLSAIIFLDTSRNIELNVASQDMLKRFGVIEEYGPYEAVLKKLCTHPNTDSKLISLFEKTLREANPKFKDKLGKTLKEGLGKRDKK